MTEGFKRFLEAQREFPEIPKNKEGQEGNRKYAYADLPLILRTITPILHDHGLFLTQRFVVNEFGTQLLTEIYYHGGLVLSSAMPTNPEKQTIKGFGSATTYYRRYGLAPLLGICPNDDDEGMLAQKTEKKKTWTPDEKQNVVTGPQIQRLYAICNNSDWTSEQVKKVMKDLWDIESSRQLNQARYELLCEMIQNKKPDEVLSKQSPPRT